MRQHAIIHQKNNPNNWPDSVTFPSPLAKSLMARVCSFSSASASGFSSARSKCHAHHTPPSPPHSTTTSPCWLLQRSFGVLVLIEFIAALIKCCQTTTNHPQRLMIPNDWSQTQLPSGGGGGQLGCHGLRGGQERVARSSAFWTNCGLRFLVDAHVYMYVHPPVADIAPR